MVLDVLHKTSDTLARLHQNYNFVHADLHHDNLMVEVDDNYQCIGIKIFDFDLSYATKESANIRLDLLPGYHGWEKVHEELLEREYYRQILFLFDMWRLWVSIALCFHTFLSNLGKGDTRELSYKGFSFNLNDFYNYKRILGDNFSYEEWNEGLMSCELIKDLYEHIMSEK